ncbi:MAG: hypothetical protein M1820_001611 [Bogoriella megaspora]|nr:MAG: hypothetical protein M1820_001611 [Bogoriella megaspora]
MDSRYSMSRKSIASTALFLCLATFARAAPAPEPVVIPEAPVITPRPTKTSPQRRDIGSDIDSITSDIGSGATSFTGELGSLATGGTNGIVPAALTSLPTGSEILSTLGISSSDLDATPTSALQRRPYGNFTDNGWQVRFNGFIYKTPNISEDRLASYANAFVVGNYDELPADEQANARNLTSEIFIVQQGNVQVTVDLVAGDQRESITLPYNTTDEGDFDVFVPLSGSHQGDNANGGSTGTNAGGNSTGSLDFDDGNSTDRIQTFQSYVRGAADTGNATAYLVPAEGYTTISDIDDILRVTKIYQPEQGLLNSFARPFTAWENMPEIYANWSQSLPNMHFHYLTTTPEQGTRPYEDFIFKTYPEGSFDDRPLNFSNVDETTSPRKYLLDFIFQTFPKRKFNLIADTSNSDVMKDYPQMVTDFPGQVNCIWLRNTSATDGNDLFPYDTSGFKNINNDSYMFFLHPNDLMNLDIENGQCRNATIPQNLTYDTQDEAAKDKLTGAASKTASGVGAFGLAVFVAIWNLV